MNVDTLQMMFWFLYLYSIHLYSIYLYSLHKEIIYKAVVSSSEGEKEYVGQTKNIFKERLATHKNTFKYSEKRINCGLAGYVWKLKDRAVALRCPRPRHKTVRWGACVTFPLGGRSI